MEYTGSNWTTWDAAEVGEAQSQQQQHPYYVSNDGDANSFDPYLTNGHNGDSAMDHYDPNKPPTLNPCLLLLFNITPALFNITEECMFPSFYSVPYRVVGTIFQGI